MRMYLNNRECPFLRLFVRARLWMNIVIIRYMLKLYVCTFFALFLHLFKSFQKNKDLFHRSFSLVFRPQFEYRTIWQPHNSNIWIPDKSGIQIVAVLLFIDGYIEWMIVASRCKDRLKSNPKSNALAIAVMIIGSIFFWTAK